MECRCDGLFYQHMDAGLQQFVDDLAVGDRGGDNRNRVYTGRDQALHIRKTGDREVFRGLGPIGFRGVYNADQFGTVQRRVVSGMVISKVSDTNDSRTNRGHVFVLHVWGDKGCMGIDVIPSRRRRRSDSASTRT